MKKNENIMVEVYFTNQNWNWPNYLNYIRVQAAENYLENMKRLYEIFEKEFNYQRIWVTYLDSEVNDYIIYKEKT